MRSLHHLLLSLVISLLFYFGSTWLVVHAKPTQMHLAFTGVHSEISLMFVDQRDEYHVPYTVEYWIDHESGTHHNGGKRTVKAFGRPYNVHDAKNGGTIVYKRSVYEALLVGLPQNTRIAYRVANEKLGQWTKTYHFYSSQGDLSEPISDHDYYGGNEEDEMEQLQYLESKDVKNERYPYSFLSYGDMDTTYASMETQEHIREVLQKDDTVRFIVHQGDIPYAWSEDKWDSWFDMMEGILEGYPYMVCTGNHEENYNFTSYKHRFTNITGFSSMGPERLNRHSANFFYSWEYANIHFIALSSEHDYAPGSLQYRWLESDLSRVDRDRTPFVIAYIHRPMYSSNENHGSELALRRDIEPLYNRYGVDLALFGHVHAYERTCEVANGVCVRNSTSVNETITDPQSTIQIHAGTAGYELNWQWDDKPAWSVFRETAHGFLRLIAEDKYTLKVEFLRNPSHRGKDGQVVGDSFTIVKSKTAPGKKRVT